MRHLQFDKTAHLASFFRVLVVNNVRIAATSDPYGFPDVVDDRDDHMMSPPASGHLLNTCRVYVFSVCEWIQQFRLK